MLSVSRAPIPTWCREAGGGARSTPLRKSMEGTDLSLVVWAPTLKVF